MTIGFFGNKSEYFSKAYIDYLLKGITIRHQFSQEEKHIITMADRKYKIIQALKWSCVYIFGYYVYKKGKLIHLNMNSFHDLHLFLHPILFRSALFVGVIYYLNTIAHKVYYSDLIYLIKKYSVVDESEYNRASMNKELIKLYNNTKFK